MTDRVPRITAKERVNLPTIPESRQMTTDDRLDEETERLIRGLVGPDNGGREKLRSRIRELVEEARKEAETNFADSCDHEGSRRD